MQAYGLELDYDSDDSGSLIVAYPVSPPHRSPNTRPSEPGPGRTGSYERTRQVGSLNNNDSHSRGARFSKSKSCKSIVKTPPSTLPTEIEEAKTALATRSDIEQWAKLSESPIKPSKREDTESADRSPKHPTRHITVDVVEGVEPEAEG
jgi:hypothetical protein